MRGTGMEIDKVLDGDTRHRSVGTPVTGIRVFFAIVSAAVAVIAVACFAQGARTNDQFLYGVVAPAVGIVAFICGLSTIVVGAPRGNSKGESAVKILTALVGTTPVLVAVALLLALPNLTMDRYVTVVLAISVLTGAFYSSLLKSSVDDWRRDALELSLMLVAFVGAIATAAGAILNVTV
jgi:hypothetical protein